MFAVLSAICLRLAGSGRIGSQLIVPYRTAGGDYQVQHLRVMGDVGQVLPLSWDIRDEKTIYNAVKHSNVVINLTGRLWDTRNFSVEDIHIKGAQRIAAVCLRFLVYRFRALPDALGLCSDMS